jgi:hypothetical protein
MAKPNAEKVERTPADRRAAFKEQILLLTLYAQQYDAGQRAMAKPMANTLRMLLHQTGKSTSLLHQLGLRQGRFFAITKGVNPLNLLTQCDLLVMRVTAGAGVQFLPTLRPMSFRERVAFPEWWGSPIIKGHGGLTMSRRDVVTAVADMDGGSHVDPGLAKAYHLFRTGELLGWKSVEAPAAGLSMQMADADPVGGPPGSFIEAPQYACIRSITHEFLLTMQKYAGWAFDTPYEFRDPTEPDRHG